MGFESKPSLAGKSYALIVKGRLECYVSVIVAHRYLLYFNGLRIQKIAQQQYAIRYIYKQFYKNTLHLNIYSFNGLSSHINNISNSQTIFFP